MEEWLKIKGFPNYEVSSLGKVRRAKDAPRTSGTRPGKPVYPVWNESGYLVVSLRGDGATKTRYVHELVCEAFMPKRWKRGMAVNHVNRDRRNNSIENLQPTDGASNSGHGRLSAKTQKEIARRAFDDHESFDTIASDLDLQEGSVHLCVVEHLQRVRDAWRKQRSGSVS